MGLNAVGNRMGLSAPEQACLCQIARNSLWNHCFRSIVEAARATLNVASVEAIFNVDQEANCKMAHLPSAIPKVLSHAVLIWDGVATLQRTAIAPHVRITGRCTRSKLMCLGTHLRWKTILWRGWA